MTGRVQHNIHYLVFILLYLKSKELNISKKKVILIRKNTFSNRWNISFRHQQLDHERIL